MDSINGDSLNNIKTMDNDTGDSVRRNTVKTQLPTSPLKMHDTNMNK